MTRRTFITILIAVLFAALLGALWYWIFAGSGSSQLPQTGTFGSGGDRQTTQTTGQGAPTNIPNQVPGSANAGGTVSTGGVINVPTITTLPSVSGSSSPASVSWLTPNSGSGSVSGGSGSTFTPASINQLNNGQVGGSVNVLGTFNNPSSSGGGNNGSGLAIGAIAGTAVACSAFLVGGAAGFSTAAIRSVSVDAPTDNTKNFMDCLARTIARAAIQQITNSVVNWINSGFNGSPSFITNYQQFFANVADQAAGSFIQNYTNFAPFCTPFAKQIQIALATSYARRDNAPSCTLTKLLGTNIFSPNGIKSLGGGGWSNFVSFTTVPSNNAFGAYLYAQNQLASAQAAANTDANRNITPNGFLNYKEPFNCQPSKTGGQPTCQFRISTPGSVIEQSLNKTLGTSLDSLNLAKSFDEIISALISQLMTRAITGGVSNLSGQSGYSSYYLTPDQQQAQSLGQEVLTEMQGLVVASQQFGQSKQGAISDIQSAQKQLNDLANCWQTAASSTDLSDTKQSIAGTNAQNALDTLHSFDAQVAALNDSVTRANAAIAILQDLQTKTLSIGSTADVGSIRTQLASAQAQGQIVGAADVIQAQQDRTTLQTQLSALNQTTQANLQQCYAFH